MLPKLHLEQIIHDIKPLQVFKTPSELQRAVRFDDCATTHHSSFQHPFPDFDWPQYTSDRHRHSIQAVHPAFPDL